MKLVLLHFRLLLKWQLLRLRTVLPLFAVVQIMTGLGFVLGLGFLVPQLDSHTAMFFVTGGPTLVLIVVGMVLLPQMISEDKNSGSLTYIWSLPVSRLVYLAADLSMWTLTTLPGVLLSLFVGSRYYDFSLTIRWSAIPVFLLVSLTASAMGYSLAHLIRQPQLVLMITNFMVFLLFLFSPINFPLERLPLSLQRLHTFLPITHMASLMRSSLTDHALPQPVLGILVPLFWLLVTLMLVGRVLQKRS